MAREVFKTSRIKLEVILDDVSLQPEVIGLVEAAKELVMQGFQVFPYCTEDLGIAEKLLEVGCELLMPWGAPIGTARGLNNIHGLQMLRSRYADIPLIIDAGLGRPSHAAQAMELGFDGVLLNTAVAKAGKPAEMAQAFALSVEAGRRAYEALMLEPRDLADASTPLSGRAFK